jgi:hypothetical protein
MSHACLIPSLVSESVCIRLTLVGSFLGSLLGSEGLEDLDTLADEC